MPDLLILRFDAPLIAFGGVLVDEHGVTRLFPARAMIAGLLGNALGYDHRDAERLQALQSRLRFAVRCDRPGHLWADYQTVDLSQKFLARGWTTRGKFEERAGGSARTGTHIRFRSFIADAVYTLALTLAETAQPPSLGELEAALHEPARPLFIGRKPCLPSTPLLSGRTAAPTLLHALETHPLARHAARDHPLLAWWPADEDLGREGSRLIPITDDRDWRNQIHVGRRWIHEGTINVHTPTVDD
jgi:CRISPR system Cascade subunit CasD